MAERIELSQASKGWSFKAIKQNGEPLTEKDIAGSLSLVNFFLSNVLRFVTDDEKYARTAKRVGQAKKQGTNLFLFGSARIRYAFEIKILCRELQNRFKSLDALTGKKKEIYRVGRSMFKADGAVGVQKSEENFIHTQNIYLVDQDLHIRGIYNSNDPSDMAQLKLDISILTKKIPRRVAGN